MATLPFDRLGLFYVISPILRQFLPHPANDAVLL
jgi:hypothetical protein